jgi:hypothetical protein
MVSKAFVTAQLKDMIVQLDWGTEHGRGHAVTIAHHIRSDLDQILTPFLPSISPTQSSGIDIDEAFRLRANLVRVTADLDSGRVAEALSLCKKALAEWETAAAKGD